MIGSQRRGSRPFEGTLKSTRKNGEVRRYGGAGDVDRAGGIERHTNDGVVARSAQIRAVDQFGAQWIQLRDKAITHMNIGLALIRRLTSELRLKSAAGGGEIA